ncbi:MAG TPA: acetamidase/formamidase family protein [candidate division Zixibacteria bacterium]|nr:acetamidase/formamidase family protein [candidate division Zixibacteria bacterium]
MAISPTIHVAREQNHLAWDPAIPPVATVASGEVIEFDCLDASFGQLTAESDDETLAALDFSRVDQVNGPVAVEGAEPGDTLQVDLLEFQPADWGWTASIPGFGLLADDFPEGHYKVTRLDGSDRAEFFPGIRVPVAPFCGELGVAPASGPLSTIPPDVHGGNMDTRHLVAGTTLFLPVFVPGANFSVGDGHAAQGDGEVCGTAIETPMRARIRLTVRKDLHVTAPEFLAAPDPHAALRNGARYATDGVGPDLMQAARDAVRRMIDWLGREHGLDPMQAYLLCSVAVDLRISEIVDVPNYIVTAHCPLGIFD